MAALLLATTNTINVNGTVFIHISGTFVQKLIFPIFPHHHKLNWLAKYRQEIRIKPQVNLNLNNINTLEACLFLFQMGKYCCIPTQPGDTFSQHKPSIVGHWNSAYRLRITQMNHYLNRTKNIQSLSPRLSTSIKPKFKMKTKAYRLFLLLSIWAIWSYWIRKYTLTHLKSSLGSAVAGFILMYIGSPGLLILSAVNNNNINPLIGTVNNISFH